MKRRGCEMARWRGGSGCAAGGKTEFSTPRVLLMVIVMVVVPVLMPASTVMSGMNPYLGQLIGIVLTVVGVPLLIKLGKKLGLDISNEAAEAAIEALINIIVNIELEKVNADGATKKRIAVTAAENKLTNAQRDVLIKKYGSLEAAVQAAFERSSLNENKRR